MSAARATAHLDEPIEQAIATVIHLAALRTWGIATHSEDRRRLVFSKGVTATSWSGSLTVELEAVGPGQTRVTVAGGRAVPPGDWGRGREAVSGMFAAAG